VRELQNVIQRYLAVKSIDFLYENTAPAEKVPADAQSMDPEELNLQDNINSLEKNIITKALLKHGENKSRAAEELGISRKTLARKLKLFEASVPLT